MVTIIKTEFMKLKRYFIVWIGVSLMLLTVLLTLFTTMADDGMVWDYQFLFEQVVKHFVTMIFPMCITLILTLLTLPLLVVVWLLKWFVMFLYCCSAWIFYLLGSVLFATAVLSFLMKQSQGMEALQMLIGGFVIFMIPQVVGSVAVFLELVAATIRQVWYI